MYESRYRSYYADKPDKDTRENLSNYVKSQYVSDNLTTVDRSDPANLGQQFELTVACDKAKRGYTDLPARKRSSATSRCSSACLTSSRARRWQKKNKKDTRSLHRRLGTDRALRWI